MIGSDDMDWSTCWDERWRSDDMRDDGQRRGGRSYNQRVFSLLLVRLSSGGKILTNALQFSHQTKLAVLPSQ